MNLKPFTSALVGIIKTVKQLVTLTLVLGWTPLSVHAQVIVATLPTGNQPIAVALNSKTNKIYVANYGDCVQVLGNVTMIDGATNNITTLADAACPLAVAVNPNTNKIYVANYGNSSVTGGVTVIDGATDATTTVTVGTYPDAIAVNPNTNQIYVANAGTNNVTVIGNSFTVATTPSSATVAAGQSGTFTLTVTPQGSFTTAISFSCSGLPSLAGCTFNPASVTPNASTLTSTVTITTAARTALLAPPSFGHRRLSPLYAIWLVMPAVLLGTARLAAPKRKKLLSFCLMSLLVGSCLLHLACAGASSSTGSGGSGTGGTPTGTYPVTITGAAGSNQHTATVTLTVQ
jgi:DNA-binding beta-propeller fold protein YncE